MIYNVLSSAQYNEAEAQGLINSDELYLLTDDENIFIAEYDVTTWSEVNAAVQDGKAVIATSGTAGETLPLVGTDPDDYFIFRGIGTGGNIFEFELDDTDDWTRSGGSTLATLVSPTFSGTPKAPTAAAGTNTTQIATTAFVKTAIDNADDAEILTYGDTSVTYANVATKVSAGKVLFAHYSTSSDDVTLPYVCTTTSGSHVFTNMVGNTRWTIYLSSANAWSVASAALAPLASPGFTGNPTAPTQAAGNNSTRIATTAFVNTAITNANNIFIAEYGTTTYANISAAESAGKILFATRTNSGVTRCLPLIEKNSGGQYIFSGEYSGTNVYYTVNSSSNWGETTYTLAAYSHSHTNYVTKAYTAGNASNYEVRYAKFLIDNSTNSSAVPDAANKIIWFYE